MDSVFFAALQAAPAQPSLFEAFLPMAIVFGIFYFLVIGPSRKKQAAQDALLKSLKAGDRVILASGIYGVIEGVEESVVYVRIADKTKIRVQRSAVAALEGSAEVSNPRKS
jgi:preprotein translocase subunit YajC